jgi:hypothetical protein
MDLYTVPSVTFFRPGCSELFQIPPGPEREYGRYDTDKLGFMLVSVTAREHRLRLIHTHGKGENEKLAHWNDLRLNETGDIQTQVSPVGISVRHTWAHRYELPFDNLDEFNRKMARNDHWLPALWEMGIQRIRLPVGDLSDDNRRRRISARLEKGFRFTFFSAGMPSDGIQEVLRRHHRLMEAWQVIVPQYRMAEVLERIETIKIDIPVRTYLSKLARLAKQWDIALNQLVIACMLAMPGMGPVIPSVSSVSQLDSNAKGGRINFCREEIREIEEILTEK